MKKYILILSFVFFYGCVKDITKDEKSVYYVGQPIEEADVNTFETINNLYAKDSNNVYFFYYEVYVLENADPKTFEILDNESYLSKDKNNCYQGYNKVSMSECEKIENQK